MFTVSLSILAGCFVAAICNVRSVSMRLSTRISAQGAIAKSAALTLSNMAAVTVSMNWAPRKA